MHHDGSSGAARIWARLAASAARLRLDLPLVLLDVILSAAAYAAVMMLRFDGSVPAHWWASFRPFVLTAVVLHVGVNWAGGLYRHVWRHASFQEARQLLSAGLLSGLLLGLLFLTGDRAVPASVVVLGALVATAFMGALRFQSRLFYFNRTGGGRLTTRVLVVGAGESGAKIVRDMQREGGTLKTVAILDDDPRKLGRRIAGIPVFGAIGQFDEAVDATRPDQILLAIPSADNDLVRRVAHAAEAAHLAVKVLPKVSDLVTGEATLRDVRDLEIEDLLGRQQVTTDLAGVQRILAGRRVLITGAGGSIGSEITRQVAQCGPSLLLMLDNDDTHLYDVAASVPEDVKAVQVLADIRDAWRMEAVFDRYLPDVVFHAAAHKHVPLLEGHASEAVATNVFGTLHLVQAAIRHNVERVIFISTDKAVEPSSVMGATKHVGEQILLTQAQPGTRFCAVRFGNVLGSRGSVIPTFVRQIRQGGPVTVTDPRMTRFFMSIEEAVQLVLQASALSEGGEVFMLEMGEPVKILDLAERMIRLSGRRVGTDVQIDITGIRPGEKLSEVLCTPQERPSPTAHPSIVSLRPRLLSTDALAAGISDLHSLTADSSDERARDVLLRLSNAAPAIIALDEAPTAESLAAW